MQKNNKVLWIIIAVLVIIIVGFAAYTMGKNSKVPGSELTGLTLGSLTTIPTTTTINTTTQARALALTSKATIARNIVLLSPLCLSSQYYIGGKCYLPSQILTNSKNPYDYVGAQHNATLDYIFKNTPINPTTQQVIDAATQYSKLSGTVVDVNSITSAANTVSTVGSKAVFSSKIQKYIDKLDTMDFSSTVGIYNQIIAIENQIIGDQLLSTSDKQVLLMGTSVARYSNFYGEIDPIIVTPKKVGEAKCSFFGDIFRADKKAALSAAAAAIAGGASQSSLGKVGAAAGAASALKAFMILFTSTPESTSGGPAGDIVPTPGDMC